MSTQVATVRPGERGASVAARTRKPAASALPLTIACLLAILLSVVPAFAQDTVPFVIPGDDGSESPTNFARLFPAPVREEFHLFHATPNDLRLAKKYGSTQKMKDAWLRGGGKMSGSLIEETAWSSGIGKWQFNPTGVSYKPTFGGKGPDGKKSIRFEAPNRSEQAHFQQLAYRSFSLKKGEPYTLSFWVRSVPTTHRFKNRCYPLRRDEQRSGHVQATASGCSEGVHSNGQAPTPLLRTRDSIAPGSSADGQLCRASSLGE